MREEFGGARWESDETDNQPGIRNPYLKLRVIPCNFDRDTASLLVDPTNRYAKGGASRAKARCNATAWLPGLIREELTPPSADGYVTFVLGSYFSDDEPLRAELSRPETFWGGQYQTFSKRIVLLDGSGSVGEATAVRSSKDGPTDTVDIAVKRK